MTISLAEDIRSVTDLKRHTREILDHIHQTGRPVVLTVNGRADSVIVAARIYEKQLKAMNLAQSKRNKPVAEIRPILSRAAVKRPTGLAKGTFTVPASFFDLISAGSRKLVSELVDALKMKGVSEREIMRDTMQFFSANDLFARHTGIELLEMGVGWAKASMKIESYHFNGAKTVHGGAIFTLADFVFAVASNSHGTLAMGINTSMSFVKAVTGGVIYAEAREQARNRKLASYSVQVTDDAGDVVAIFQGMVYRKGEAIFPANSQSN